MNADGSGHRHHPADLRAAGGDLGTVYLRVVNTDQSRNQANVDAVRIDEMYLSTTS